MSEPYEADVYPTMERSRGADDWSIAFDSWRGTVSCRISQWNAVSTLAQEDGATWPEALCRAALALAATLDTGEGEA